MLKLNRLLLTSGGSEYANAISDFFSNIQVQVVDAQKLLDLSLDDSTWLFIDWLLPVMAGMQLVRLLRESGRAANARISMVLPQASEDIQMRALQAGADDYIIGPLSPEKLIDRMRIYRSAVPQPREPVLRLGDLTVDTNAFSVRYRDRVLALKVSEFHLMAHFARHPNRVFTRSTLIGVMGRGQDVDDERTVDVWISRLRTKLRQYEVPYELRTVRSFGYILDVI